ncbi:exo-alpha-sialidase [Gilvimarinus sp. DA14]|uniref:sialidase family protein n=1 Tax=Gilvimarinus sp. DA14 TaxID=2956798 RepID=UPI0020B7D517|nr:sialidase family protein [Gilvimarinus sp. DA14]UTF61549.1 exo-alpha-sialidase [Gilvimarinus sp. DA14]
MRVVLVALSLLLAVACAHSPADKPSALVAEALINPAADYPQSHASSIAQTTDGDIVATWFSGLHERHPQVAIYFARQQEGKWQSAQQVATGQQADGSWLPTWNPVLFQPPQSDLHLFYKVGPNPREWWGMVMTSADGGITWSEPRRLPEGILGPIKNKPVVTGMGAWLSPSSTEGAEGWRLHFEISKDQGASWTKTSPVDPGPGIDAIQPSVLFYPDGRLQALARTKQGVIGSSWSVDRGKSWSPVAAIELPNPSSGTDAVTLADGRQLLVYNHAAHNPDTPGKGPRYPLALATSRDGVHWQRVLTLEDQPLKEGYGYPAIIQTEDDLVHITYTLGRERIKHMVVDPHKF